jgi:nucleoside-diphosphate-sugar epimerase
MKILISGVFGFLGFKLAEKLAEKHNVIGLYNSTKKSFNKHTITCYDNLEDIEVVPDVVVLCHASVSSGLHTVETIDLFNSNVYFTEKVLNKFKQTKVIYISSVSVFGGQDEVVSEETKTKPETSYAISKYWAEHLVKQNRNNIIIRLSSLYGIGMKENTLIPNYVNQALTNKNIQVWGDGSRSQNYIHVEDVISLIEKSIELREQVSFPLLGVAGKEYTNDEVAKIICKLTDAKVEYVNKDNSKSSAYDNLATKTIFDWSDDVVLDEGVNEYIKWKRKQY